MKIEYLTGALMLALILLLNNFRGELFVNAEPYWWCQASILLLGLYEIAAVFIVNKKYKSVSPRQSINIFIGLKTGKILLAVFFVMLYVLMIKMEMRRFIIIFVTLYLIFLAFDTIYLVCSEKNRIIKNEK